MLPLAPKVIAAQSPVPTSPPLPQQVRAFMKHLCSNSKCSLNDFIARNDLGEHRNDLIALALEIATFKPSRPPEESDIEFFSDRFGGVTIEGNSEVEGGTEVLVTVGGKTIKGPGFSDLQRKIIVDVIEYQTGYI